MIKLKNMRYLMISIMIAIVGAGIVYLRQDKDTWICEGSVWTRHGNPSSPPPADPCPAGKKEGYIETVTEGLNKAKSFNQQSYTVDLNGQGLTALPTEFFEGKENVRTLNVSQNSLTGALPAEIRKIEQLRNLDASENSLTGIPAEIGQLKYLESIDFSNNKIDTFPQEIANLKDTLKVLDVRGNPFSQGSLDELKKLLPDTDIKI